MGRNPLSMRLLSVDEKMFAKKARNYDLVSQSSQRRSGVFFSVVSVAFVVLFSLPTRANSPSHRVVIPSAARNLALRSQGVKSRRSGSQELFDPRLLDLKAERDCSLRSQ